MMTQDALEAFMYSLGKVRREYPFEERLAVYKLEDETQESMIALVEEGSSPLRVSLRCDPQLARMLRERYETVLPGQNLSKKHWNTIICSGQLAEEEVFDLVRHSFLLAQKDIDSVQ